MDINLIRALVTFLGLVLFVAIAWWAFKPKNKKRFEQDARIPFDSDGPEEGRR